nr:MAG TPA: Muramidase (flagellum-specific) [Caudoviricetes sp.]
MRTFPIISGNHSEFFNELAPIVCNEWVGRRRKGERTISPAVAMAQAALESGYNINASSLFGIKGEGFTSSTEEYIKGIEQTIVASFVKYPSITASIIGYYDLMQDDNYADATAANTVEGELYGLTNAVDEGYDADGNWVGYNYATDPQYYSKCLWIVNEYGLRAYNDYVWSVINSDDDIPTEEPVQPDQELDEDVIDAIYRGEYGNDPERRQNLEAAGYNYADYQAAMEAKYYHKDDTPAESEEEPEEETSQEAEERVAVVEPGEGFWQVAERALGDGTRYLELAEFNGMDISTPLYVGMELKLPN